MQTLVRPATVSDVDALVELRAEMFRDMGVVERDLTWRTHCREWFRRVLATNHSTVHVVVAEVDRTVVACGMAELSLGAPGPTSPSGRTAHISNLSTRSSERRQGHGYRVMNALLEWSATVADRAELHASPNGFNLYDRLGFETTANPSMRLRLH